VHWPALDGVRAVAVAAVVVYHARPGWLRGGFLGVDVFFVLSGFLITSLLLRERRSAGRVSLRAFWARRARRLLPALYLLLAVVLAYEVLFHLTGVARLRWDALAALGYTSNWFLLLHQQSYFAAFALPDALQHLWSLAVEEQFYVVWPLLCAIGVLRGRRALVPVLAAAAGSTVLCALLYDPTGDPSRVYFGTDTHSAGLLLGAALAIAHLHFWPRPARTQRVSQRTVAVATALGALALVAIAAGFVLLDELQPLAYRGGLTAIALAAAVLVGVLLHPAGRVLARAFASRPVRWVGVRSYGIYLWHWPVLVLTSPHGVPAESPIGWVVLQVGASVALAAASYRYLETPIRSGAALRAARRWWAQRGQRRIALHLAWGAAGGAALGAACALLVAVAASRAPATPPYQRTVAVHLSTRAALPVRVARIARPATSPVPVAAPTATAPPATPAPPTPTAAPLPPPRVTAIGDSVMLGAATALARDVPNLDLDAKVGRQMSAALDILRADAAAGRLGDVVVVHMGNNGVLTTDQLGEMMQLLANTPVVVLVNDKVPRPWQDPNDGMLQQLAARHANVRLVDWRSASSPHPEYFWDDDTHLRPDGARFYAALVAAQVPAVDPVAAAAAAAATAAAPAPTPLPERNLT
jgi:peptidoglycan/LPS O-acetylase OafA/YrhL